MIIFNLELYISDKSTTQTPPFAPRTWKSGCCL